MNLMVSNSGQEVLNTDFSITDANVFSASPDFLFINPGETKELQIKFRPTEDYQYYNSYLVIRSNDPMLQETKVKLECTTGGINGTIHSDLKNVIVSPNPTDGLFFISGEATSNDLNIELTDPQGRLIYKKEIKHAGKFHEEVDISNLPKGFYILQLSYSRNIKTYKMVLK